MEVGSNGGEDGEDDDEDDGSGGAGLTSWMQELHMSVANDDMASFKAILAKEDVRKDLEVTTNATLIERKSQGIYYQFLSFALPLILRREIPQKFMSYY